MSEVAPWCRPAPAGWPLGSLPHGPPSLRASGHEITRLASSSSTLPPAPAIQNPHRNHAGTHPTTYTTTAGMLSSPLLPAYRMGLRKSVPTQPEVLRLRGGAYGQSAWLTSSSTPTHADKLFTACMLTAPLRCSKHRHLQLTRSPKRRSSSSRTAALQTQQVPAQAAAPATCILRPPSPLRQNQELQPVPASAVPTLQPLGRPFAPLRLVVVMAHATSGSASYIRLATARRTATALRRYWWSGVWSPASTTCSWCSSVTPANRWGGVGSRGARVCVCEGGRGGGATCFCLCMGGGPRGAGMASRVWG